MEELRLKIIDLCNQSGLPMEALVFVIRDVYRDVNETYKQVREAQAKQAAEIEETPSAEEDKEDEE